jgi:tRNA nucleotidyltransferase (CCA-adding enzyme)
MPVRFALPEPVLSALSRLAANGHEAYLVGGCVRDDWLGIPPKDYDLCTSATPGQVHACFAGEKMADTGIRHGTVMVILQGMPLEITTFRTDLLYKDGRHPESVAFTRSLTEDLARRDFTVNAMAWHMDTGMVDPFGGREDCWRKRIACVGDPEARFGEDALRILRAMRFASVLGFTVSPSTAQAMHALKARLALISRERVGAELNGLLAGAGPSGTLAEFGDVLFAAVPQAAVPEDRWMASLNALRHCARDMPTRWALLFTACDGREQPDAGGYPPAAFRDNASARKAREALLSLRASGALLGEAESLAGLACIQLQPKDVRKWMSRVSSCTLDRLIELKSALAVGYPDAEINMNDLLAIREEKARALRLGLCFSLKQLAVNGRDLAALGYAGSGIGSALNMLLDRVLSDKASNEREALLALAAGWRTA